MNAVVAERVLPTSHRLQLVRGDLTAEASDAIVNAANAHLIHGGGVAGAIARGGGAAIQEESDRWIREHGLVTHERPAWTSAGQLPAKYVIHAVGPVWGEGNEDAKLGAAVRGALKVADELELESVSLPAISTGIYGFPKERAAGVILRALRDYFSGTESGIKSVRVVLMDKASVEAFMPAWDEIE